MLKLTSVNLARLAFFAIIKKIPNLNSNVFLKLNTNFFFWRMLLCFKKNPLDWGLNF